MTGSDVFDGLTRLLEKYKTTRFPSLTPAAIFAGLSHVGCHGFEANDEFEHFDNMNFIK